MKNISYKDRLKEDAEQLFPDFSPELHKRFCDALLHHIHRKDTDGKKNETLYKGSDLSADLVHSEIKIITEPAPKKILSRSLWYRSYSSVTKITVALILLFCIAEFPQVYRWLHSPNQIALHKKPLSGTETPNTGQHGISNNSHVINSSEIASVLGKKGALSPPAPTSSDQASAECLTAYSEKNTVPAEHHPDSAFASKKPLPGPPCPPQGQDFEIPAPGTSFPDQMESYDWFANIKEEPRNYIPRTSENTPGVLPWFYPDRIGMEELPYFHKRGIPTVTVNRGHEMVMPVPSKGYEYRRKYLSQAPEERFISLKPLVYPLIKPLEPVGTVAEIALPPAAVSVGPVVVKRIHAHVQDAADVSGMKILTESAHEIKASIDMGVIWVLSGENDK